ncbi:MAG TPA: hypothetical protein VGN93_31210 [Shinella sp.]|jgi:hypothetical protein|uniref:hypothetical protein n=1 Tax=Shinella sp. TaxID=1870904 RepID=UPI002E152EC9|nr:hypothetical protein [Shinella sp.]
MTVATAPRLALYRVTFHDGRAISLNAANSPSAEAAAKRQHPGGFVRKVTFLRMVSK